jgi:hypothetical protein
MSNSIFRQGNTFRNWELPNVNQPIKNRAKMRTWPSSQQLYCLLYFHYYFYIFIMFLLCYVIKKFKLFNLL